MSEYSEKQSIAKLIGSPPGYVGHEDGGLLTEAVRKRPHSVILFDEIEKADKELMNLLLQISDYGYLTDSGGRRVSFRNTIIIATTNIGAQHSTDTIGFEGETKKTSDCTALLKKHYKEEFINRFDEIITFSPLSPDTLKQIVDERLNVLSLSLRKRGYTFTYSKDVAENIVKNSHIKGLGARPTLRDIDALIEDKIIDLIVSGDIDTGVIVAEVIDEKLVVTSKKAIKT